MVDGARTLAEQLAPFQRSVRQRHSSVVPISQVLLQIRSDDLAESFASVRREVLNWVAQRSGRPLPAVAWNGESFDLEDIGAQRVAAVQLEEPRYWAVRLDDSDKQVPQRTWVTEVGVGERPGGGVLLGARLICVTRGRDEPYHRSIPGFVRLAARPGTAWLDGVPTRPAPWVISTRADVEALVHLLVRPRRTDVIVFSLPETSENPAETIAPAERVWRLTYGAAHVVVLTGPASYHLSDIVGKEFSVFRQAVRSYRPGFNPEQDEPYAHPLALPARILEWPDGGIDAYAEFLVRQSLLRTVAGSDALDAVPPFSAIRKVATDRRLAAQRNVASSDRELLAIAEEELQELRLQLAAQKKEADELLETADEERDQALAEAETAKARASALRARVERLEHALQERTDQSDDLPIPASLEDLASWAQRYLAGSVELHNRAIQGAKKSQFLDVSLIYNALLLLRDCYVPMKRQGGLNFKQVFESRCAELGLTESQTFSANTWGEQGDTYVVRVGGRPRMLDRHLKNGGNTRDPRRCFRLYFYWDDDSEQVVVGWLPSHLESRAT